MPFRAIRAASGLPVTSFADHLMDAILLLGSRAGSRPYLSEDIEILERLSSIMAEQVERMRNIELQSLVSLRRNVR